MRFLLICFLIHSLDARAMEDWERCIAEKMLASFVNPDDLIAAQPYVKTHPLELRISAGMLFEESRQPFRYKSPEVYLLTNEGTRPSIDDAVMPLWKIEPRTLQVLWTTHARIAEDDQLELFPGRLTNSDVARYQHLFPHPAILQLFHARTTAALRTAYPTQKLPYQAWETLVQDDFSQAGYRTAEVNVSEKNVLRGHLKVFLGTKSIPIEEQLFGDAIPNTFVFSFNHSQGSFEPWLTPVEHLLRRFHIAENPVEDLRQQHPDFAIVEIGRYYINPKDGLEPEDKIAEIQRIKRLLMNGLITLLREFAPQNNLNKIIAVASGGPFGIRQYPKEFNMGERMRIDMQEVDMTPYIPEGAEQIDNATLTWKWIPDLRELDQPPLPQDELRDIGIFSATGWEILSALKGNNMIDERFPTLQEMLAMSYETTLGVPHE